jgi:hypothetical protein
VQSHRIVEAIILSCATASVAFTVSEAVVFQGLRAWCKAKNPWLGKLVNCGYCLGHWVAFALVGAYRTRLFERWWPLDFVLTGLVVAWIAGFQWTLMCWLFTMAKK